MKGAAKAVGRKFPARCVAAIALGSAFILAANAIGKSQALAMLDSIQPGLWELREHGERATRKRLCISHGHELIQLRHPGEACSSFIVEDSPAAVTVQYTCRGTGYGRTRLRDEGPGLVQMETQGVQKGLPFEFHGEARRIGNCPG